MIRALALPLLLAACAAAPETRRDAPPRQCHARAAMPEASLDAAPGVGGAWFPAPCPLMANDPLFVAQVQRALAARGLYRGEASGFYDAATRDAVRRYQGDAGPDSDWLSLDAARRLGLVTVARDAG
ncbi:peptidoglycan-binding domain-containing protein [Jannaschia sp. W003]|uniref:peptidoglycan-binding domain-containing protein n=1 Tax=Jannaschia sp. W003 TaxID=2867012 RepID=UPI0021A606B5|nr:peptidoglycan-binding domain-containing protein [Jannaschia sp. W003]UWQ22782.1 peptidoglycan-binding protein [Jannaschia sp. W003]